MNADSRPNARFCRLGRIALRGSAPLLAVLLLSACAMTEVKVDSLAKPKAEDAISYQINNRNPLLADDSLRYKEAAGFVKTALSGKGMYEAPKGVKADVVVDLDYGVSPPQIRREVVTEPVYVMVPGQPRAETRQVGTNSKGEPVYETTMGRDPSTKELDGYRERIVTVVVYEKYLKLSARSNQEVAEGRPPAEVWTVDVTSEGRSRDIRKSLPVLVGASIDYIGKDSHGQKTLRIKDDDPDVAFVKKGM